MIQIERQPKLTFPAVTICNQNKVHCGHVQKMVEWCRANSTCRSHTQMETYCDLYIYGQCETSVNISEMFHYGEIRSSPQCSEFSINMDNKTANDYNLKRKFFQSKFMKYYSRLSMDEALALSHQPKDMFKKCTFESTPDNPDCHELIDGHSRCVILTSTHTIDVYSMRFLQILQPTVWVLLWLQLSWSRTCGRSSQ